MPGSRSKKKSRQEEPEDTEGLSDDERTLREDKAKFQADVYKHFHPAQILRDSKGEKQYYKEHLKYSFQCKKNPSEICIRHRGNSSTSCLRVHVEKCEPSKSASRDVMERFAAGCSYQQEDFHILCLKWIIQNCRPFSIVEDKELRALFSMCFKGVKIPREHVVSRHIKIFHSMCFKKVISTLDNYKGAIHIGLDAWTAGNSTPFLGITLHRCVDGEIKSMILDFIHLTENHTGEYLATEVHKCLGRFGILSKLRAIAGDNASNNEKMLKCLAQKLDSWEGKKNQVRCLGHILSLAMRAFLKPFTKRGSSGNKEFDKELGALEECEDEVDEAALLCHTTDALRSDKEFLKEAEQERPELISKLGAIRDKEKREGISMLTKCTSLAKAINKSDEKKRAYTLSFKTVRKSVDDPNALKRAVETRWNSHAGVILQQRTLRDVIVHLCSSAPSKKLGLDKYLLSPSEWTITDDMQDILETFIEATHFVSQDDPPLVFKVIPLVDKIYDILEDACDDEQKHMLVRYASGCATAVFDKYKTLIEESDIYKVAMLLHPRYKTSYFRRRNWSELRINSAVSAARKIWEEKYRTKPIENPSTSQSMDRTTSKKRRFTDLDDFEEASNSSASDAFETYILSPTFKVKDPLKYWDAQLKANSDEDLARFALDYLSAPATSIDVERAFSLGGRVITKLRNRLSEESARASIVLASWLDYPAFSAEKEMKEKLVVMRQRRKKASGKNGERNSAEMDEDDEGMDDEMEEDFADVQIIDSP